MRAIRYEIGGSWIRFGLSVPLDVVTLIFLFVVPGGFISRYLSRDFPHHLSTSLIIFIVGFSYYYRFIRRKLLDHEFLAAGYLVLFSSVLVLLPLLPLYLCLFVPLVSWVAIHAMPSELTTKEGIWTLMRVLGKVIYEPEPLLISLGAPPYGKLAFDKHFRKDIGYWNRGTVETQFFSAEVLLRENETEFLNAHKEKMTHFLTACYDDQNNLFRLEPSHKSSSAHYSYCAFGAIKSVNGIRTSDWLGEERASQFLGRDRSKRFEQSVFQTAVNLLTGGESNVERTLLELYSCYRILQNLESYELLERLNKHDLTWYIKAHLVVSGSDGTHSFGDSINGRGCVSGSYFAVRLFRALDVSPPEEIDSDRLRHFVLRCWNDDIGGFSSAPRMAPNLVHTRMALQILRNLSGDCVLDALKLRKIASFVKACQSPDGFSFYPGLAVNAYAYRCALDIIRELHDLGLSTDRLRPLSVKNSVESLIHKFYDAKQGVFCGYRIPTVSRILSRSLTEATASVE